MQQRPLGTSGIYVSPIALGCWAMGGAEESWGQVDDNESIAAIHQALDDGINLIDTAPIYGLGHSEKIVGRAIAGRRDKVVLATKVGLLFPRNGREQPRRCLKPDSVRQEVEQSLRRLRSDYIDLLQCHWPDPDTPISETMDALQGLLRQGKIRAIGVSNFSCEQLTDARQHGSVHCLQLPFSIVQPRAAEDLIPYCRKHDIGVVSYSPLAKGLLTGKFSPESKFEGIRSRDPEFLGQRFERNLRVVESLRPIARKYNVSVAQLAINWIVAEPGMTAAIVGAKRPSQVQENLGGAGWTLTDEDRDRINQLIHEM